MLILQENSLVWLICSLSIAELLCNGLLLPHPTPTFKPRSEFKSTKEMAKIEKLQL